MAFILLFQTMNFKLKSKRFVMIQLILSLILKEQKFYYAPAFYKLSQDQINKCFIPSKIGTCPH